MSSSIMARAKPKPADAEQKTPATPSFDILSESAPASGRRAAFQDIKRELTDEELKSPGTQKLLLDMLFTAEAERDRYKDYVEKFHTADKQASVLEEQLKRNKTNETLFAVGIGVGGTIIGLAPTFWSLQNINGQICLGVGAFLVLGATIGRIAFR